MRFDGLDVASATEDGCFDHDFGIFFFFAAKCVKVSLFCFDMR